MNKLDSIRSLYAALERAGMLRFRDDEDMAGELRRAAAALDRINLARRNGVDRWDAAAGRFHASGTDADEARAEKVEERARARALAVVERLNAGCNALLAPGLPHVTTFRARFGGDPRGASIELFVAPDDPETGSATACF